MPDNDRDLIDRVTEHLRRPVDIGAGFESAVMDGVLGERQRRRPYRLFAALGSLAAAAGVVLFLVPRHAPAPPAAGRNVATEVRFELVAPQASSVAVVGDFNDWRASGIPLSRAASGRWTAIALLPPGLYNYAFLVDGTQWTLDPAAPRAAADDFGRPNSVVTVGGPSL